MNETTPQLLKKFLDGLNKAIGGTSQMVHQHEDIRFIPIYQKLSLVRDKTMDVAMKATGIEVKHGIAKR